MLMTCNQCLKTSGRKAQLQAATRCQPATKATCPPYGDLHILGKTFRPLSCRNQDLENAILAHPTSLSGYPLPYMEAWEASHRHRYAFMADDCLLISVDVNRLGNVVPAYEAFRHEKWFLQPIGEFAPSSQEQLIAAVHTSPDPILFHLVSRQFIDTHPGFVSHFKIENDRASANYIYDASSLAELAGRRLQKKRNLVHQFERAYAHVIAPVEKSLLSKCAQLAVKILDETPDTEGSFLTWETLAILRTLRHWNPNFHRGTALLIDGNVVAFSVWFLNGKETATIQFEKADRAVKGSYQAINRSTARQVLEAGIPFVNREEDLGLEGLRQAKLSYDPIRLEESFVLRWDP